MLAFSEVLPAGWLKQLLFSESPQTLYYRSDCIQHSTGAASLHVLAAILGLAIYKGCENMIMCPKEGNKDAERTGGDDV